MQYKNRQINDHCSYFEGSCVFVSDDLAKYIFLKRCSSVSVNVDKINQGGNHNISRGTMSKLVIRTSWVIFLI